MPSAGNPVPGASCVKIYLCSNPEGEYAKRSALIPPLEDLSPLMQVFVLIVAGSASERGALRERVFPKLVERCRLTLGLDVRVRTINVEKM